jgi:hypothetical protein
MAPRTLALDAPRSRLAVRTRAVGMLARLAHDLEIVATRLDARAELDGDAFRGELTFPVDGLEIAGVLKGDRVDPNVLSTSDRAEILKRMRADAFRGAPAVEVRASGTSRERAEIVITVGGRSANATVALDTREDGDAIAARGTAKLSLKSLGAREIKAPLGAFSVKDDLEVAFDLRFR